MPNDNPPLEAISVAAPVLANTRRPKGTIAKHRPSFTPENAAAWKPIFDGMIADRQTKKVSCQLSGYSASTLYIKANDALRWLSEFDPQPGRYLQFRQQIGISKEWNAEGEAIGIILYFKNTMSAILASSVTNVVDASRPEANWKDALQEWLQVAQSEEIWDSRKLYANGIPISDADKEWLVQLFAGIEGVEADIQQTYVRVMR